MIALMAVMLRLFVSREDEEAARAHAEAAEPGHQHHMAGADERDLAWRLTSAQAWSDVAHNFRGDWQMLWREIATGFLLAGFAAQLPNHFFQGLFVHNAPAPIPALENAVVGPVIAVLSFVCSVGNVPLAAVLWSGGIGFSGVLAFLFADLIVLPIIAIYRKYYGTRFALKITALMFVTMVVAALVVAGAFHLLGAIPAGPRPSRAHIFSSVKRRLQAGAQRARRRDLRRAVLADRPPGRHRPDVRDEGRPRAGRHPSRPRRCRRDGLLLFSALRASVRRAQAAVATTARASSLSFASPSSARMMRTGTSE